MKRILLVLLFFILFSATVFADDDWSQMYENDADIQMPVPVITDKEYKEAYDLKMGKKKKKNPYENIRGNDMSSLNSLQESYPTVILTKKFYTDDGKILEEGHYKVVVVIPKEKTGTYYVHFYQGNSHMGKMKMFETNNDYDEPTINYAKVVQTSDETKFIYGNIDCNLECTMWEVK